MHPPRRAAGIEVWELDALGALAPLRAAPSAPCGDRALAEQPLASLLRPVAAGAAAAAAAAGVAAAAVFAGARAAALAGTGSSVCRRALGFAPAQHLC
jgi:hypothetical protein